LYKIIEIDFAPFYLCVCVFQKWGRNGYFWICAGLDSGSGPCRPDRRATGGRLRQHLVVEFKTADGDALAISIPRTEAHVIRHFQERMPYGLFVPEVPLNC
jgi:hypothetical protein